jgi:hypothetical protein
LPFYRPPYYRPHHVVAIYADYWPWPDLTYVTSFIST